MGIYRFNFIPPPQKKVCKQNLRTELQNKILVLINQYPFPLPKNFALVLYQPDCKPGLILVAVHVENPTLVPRALLVRPAQHKPWARLKKVIYLRFCILTNETLVAVPHWFLSQEWQRKVRRSHRRLEFSQKRKPPNLRSCFLFIYILFFSEEKIPKPEEPRAHKLTKCKTKSLDIWRTTVSEKLMSAFMMRIVRQNAPDTVTNPVNGTKFSF